MDETGRVPLRALIVDDEPPARARLRTLLEAERDVAIVGECASGPEAIEAIERDLPHLVFLDVQMPVMDGFEVLRSLDVQRLPAIIFVTAYDDYAVRAFEIHALDYLLKPFSRDRFREALARARAQLARDGVPAVDPRVLALLDALGKAAPLPKRLLVKSEGRLVFVKVADIDWVEAAANYVRLHVRGESYLLRESMKNMEAKLPPDTFLRIHRSAIVNIDRIRELQPWFHGEYVAILHDGTKLTVSRAYAERVHELIG
jgi:two-component system LytT family response regulator